MHATAVRLMLKLQFHVLWLYATLFLLWPGFPGIGPPDFTLLLLLMVLTKLLPSLDNHKVAGTLYYKCEASLHKSPLVGNLWLALSYRTHMII